MRKTVRDRTDALAAYFSSLFVSRLRRRVFAVIVVVALLAFIFLFSSKGLISRMELSSQKHQLEQQLRDLHTTEDSLRAVRDRLQNDSFAIEQVAREKFGLIRPGETVYRRDTSKSSK